jgi:hypothetical protein
MGAAYYGLDFFNGLGALFKTFPLAWAAARCQAAAQRSDSGTRSPDAAAWRYAVAVIDHNFGRSRLLQKESWAKVSAHFSHATYRSLIRDLLGRLPKRPA